MEGGSEVNVHGRELEGSLRTLFLEDRLLKSAVEKRVRGDRSETASNVKLDKYLHRQLTSTQAYLITAPGTLNTRKEVLSCR